MAANDEMPLVREIMLEAFEEYRGVLNPPSGALNETLEDVQRGAAEGGALLAFLDGEPVGSARYACRESHIYFSRISVLPSARGHGLAGAMLEYIQQLAKRQGFAEVRLSTREVMESNLRLYLSHGYEIVGRAQHPKGEGIVVELVRKID